GVVDQGVGRRRVGEVVGAQVGDPGDRVVGWHGRTGHEQVEVRGGQCPLEGGGAAVDGDGRVGQPVTGPWTPPVPAGAVGAERAVAVGGGELGDAAEGAGAGRGGRGGGRQEPRGGAGAW